MTVKEQLEAAWESANKLFYKDLTEEQEGDLIQEILDHLTGIEMKLAYSESDELPKEPGIYWIKYYTDDPSFHREMLIKIKSQGYKDCGLFLISFMDSSSGHSYRSFYEIFNVIAYCEVHKPWDLE